MGLDPNANRVAAALAQPTPQPLEPAFPYTNITFDASYFGADQDPTLPDGATAYQTD